MVHQLQNYWNTKVSKIPTDKTTSNYALKVEELFPRNAVVCDLGCSTGADSLYFLKQGHTVSLVDISNRALELAKSKIQQEKLEKHATFHTVDLTNEPLPFANGYFDIVYSRLALHYFPRERTLEIFKDISRTLKSNGSAYLVIKSPNDLEEVAYLNSHAKEIEDGVFLEGDTIKTRFTHEQIPSILKETLIPNFTVTDYIEQINTNDFVKSGAKSFNLTEIQFSKTD